MVGVSKKKASRFWLLALCGALLASACSARAEQQPIESESTLQQVVTTQRLEPVVEPTLVATARSHVTDLLAFAEPNGPPIELPFGVPNPHQFGSAMTLMVTEGEAGDPWLKVQLPIRPNGSEGWINAVDYEVGEVDYRAEVDLSERSVVVYEGREVVSSTKAVVGSSATPTPLGTFYVTAKKENSESYLGPWALALSSFSEVHETFAGGLPVIAIHGTNRPEQVGESRSNGCIRVPNDIITLLAETVPLGTPVEISA